ncbi:uncharacterized protein [Takifugu rubripes]|uniref:uncharacterized protein n=1 Tax=Takifugu rubripes TaxID=31033 RepID=UPI0011454156|nr:uncharacterized protein LOC115251352 [Takifugu rubripes]
MLSLKISFVSAGLSKSYAAGSRIAQDTSFSPQHSQADIAKKVLHGQNSDIMNKLRRKAPPPPPSPPPPPPAPTFLSTYIGEGGCITIGYDPHFPPPPSSILPVLNEEQYCPITLESRRGVNLNKVDTPSSELDINKVSPNMFLHAGPTPPGQQANELILLHTLKEVLHSKYDKHLSVLHFLLLNTLKNKVYANNGEELPFLHYLLLQLYILYNPLQLKNDEEPLLLHKHLIF